MKNYWYLSIFLISYFIIFLVSYALTSGCYYLFTIIMNFCFATNIVFSWKSAFGVWFIIFLFNLVTK